MDLFITILTSALWVILAIAILVFIHELGHFLAAKFFGMRVERFSVGFPPNILSKRYGETEYVVGATPLGGYVRVSGMIDESLDTEDLADEPEGYEYRSKPVWQRMIFITAGVIFNVVLAVIIFAGINFAQGELYIPAEKVDGIHVAENSLADRIGLKTGDRILAVNGEEIESYAQFRVNTLVAADPLRLTVDRNGETKEISASRDEVMSVLNSEEEGKNRAGNATGITIDPAIIGGVGEGMPADSVGIRPGDRVVGVGKDTVRYWMEMSALISKNGRQPTEIRWLRPDSIDTVPENARRVSGSTRGTVYAATLTPASSNGDPVIGVMGMSGDLRQQVFDARFRQYGLGEAVVVGARDTWEYSATIVLGLKRVITGRDDPRESLGGPVKIAQITSQAAQAGAAAFWRIVAILSVTLAIMNILPIPALDGGHLMFLLYEAVTRREPSTRVRLIAQQIGMILLLGLMTFLIFNDFMRL